MSTRRLSNRELGLEKFALIAAADVTVVLMLLDGKGRTTHESATITVTTTASSIEKLFDTAYPGLWLTNKYRRARVLTVSGACYFNMSGNGLDPDDADYNNGVTAEYAPTASASGGIVLVEGMDLDPASSAVDNSSNNSTVPVSGGSIDRLCIIGDASIVLSIEIFDLNGNTVFQGTVTATTTAKSLRNLYNVPGTYPAWNTDTYASVLFRNVAAGNVYYNFGGSGLVEAGAPYGVTTSPINFSPTVGGTYSSALTTGTQLGTYFGA